MTAWRAGRGSATLGEPTPTARERRRTERMDAQVRATVRSLAVDASPARARTVDISEHGARLLMRRQLQPGERVEVDLECELPLRVHMGFDADSLVIDGPMHTHLVRIEARVARCMRRNDRMWDVGIEFDSNAPWHDRQMVQTYVDHLREYTTWYL